MGQSQSTPTPPPSKATYIPPSNPETDEKDLKCPVCHNYFAPPYVPKQLPQCEHIVCEKCIPNLIKNSRIEVGYESYEYDGKLRCPECREAIKPPSSYQTNLRLQNMAEKKKMRQDNETSSEIREVVQITVRNLQGNDIVIDNLWVGDSVLSLKHKLTVKTGISVGELWLTYLNKKLDETKTLAFYGISHGCTIQLNLRSLGGTSLLV